MVQFTQVFVVVAVLGSLIAAVALNAAVLVSCNYFKGSTVNGYGSKGTNVRIGLFRFSVDDPNSADNTDGDCERYSDGQLGHVPNTVRVAQVCGVVAATCGLLLILMVLLGPCGCPAGCSGFLSTAAFFGAILGTALVWLLDRNEVCDKLVGGCQWGDAAIYNLGALIMYCTAFIFEGSLPSSQERRSKREQVRSGNQEDQAPMPSSSEDDMVRLQGELRHQKQRIQELETEYSKTREALAVATAEMSTVDGDDPRKVNSSEEQLAKGVSERHHELKQERDLPEQAPSPPVNYASKLKELEEDNAKTKETLAAATAASSASAAPAGAEIQKLSKEHDEQTKQLQEAQKELQESEATIRRLREELAEANAESAPSTTTKGISYYNKDEETMDLLSVAETEHRSNKTSSRNTT
jgi:hypothetical protein